MKRAGDTDTEAASKKPRSHSPDYFQVSRKRRVKDLLHLGRDDNGHIEGKVFMIWPPRNRLHRVNLEVVEDSTIYRFEVEVPHREGITFRPHDHINLALRGMQAERRKDSSSPHYFPIVLRYPDGVVLEYLSGINAGKVVDTWHGNTDEWYDPGNVHTVAEAVIHDVSEAHDNPVLEVACATLPPRQRTDVTHSYHEGAISDRTSTHQQISSVHHAQATRQARQPHGEKSGRPSTAKSRKRKRQLQRERDLAHRNQAAKDERPPDVPRPGRPDVSTGGLSEVPHTALNLASCKIDEDSRGQTSVSTGSASGSSPEINPRDPLVINAEPRVPPPRLVAGIRTQRGDVFHALNDIQKSHSMINVIGIVTSVSPEKKTSTNECSRSFTIIDSSTVNSGQNGLTVNCFQKKYIEWLPQVEKDDIVILRRLKVTEFKGLVRATGFHDKLRWAVYDPSTHAIRPPNKGDAPEKEAIDDGMGYEFSPYWEPFEDSVELEYCRQVAEWWKALQELPSQSLVTVECTTPIRKEHLLISEASPDRQPRGFFNCTVEVLQKFDNPVGATVVYVTDYTSNPLLHPVQATWCPPELSDYVLQCDMWDGAKALARLMKPGEYWYFYNVRAKWNPSQYMEATMQLAEKVTQLDEARLEVQPNLGALLARKKEFGRNAPGSPIASGSSHIFPDVLLQDAEEGTNFITCTVELLHINVNSRDGQFIYVTDYTYNPNLPGSVSTADWARGLDHRIVRIKLDDAQARNAVDLKVGSIYTIRNLRLRHVSTIGGLQGRLGGEDRLIIPLYDSSSQRTEILSRSKEKWQREFMLDHPATLPNILLDQSRPPSDKNVAHDTSLEPTQNRVRILARVVDFFPFSLEDACVLRCNKCDTSLHPSFKQCPRCDDMMESHCKWVYCCYLRLQDEAGNKLDVSLSGEECTLLRGVEAADFRCDPAAFRKFLQKLEPILGNLRHVHSAWSENEDQVIESPQMRFTLETWKVGEERGYGLLDCFPV